MMELVKKAPRLRDTSAYRGSYMAGTSPANLHNSLEYAAFLLKDRLPAEKAHIPKKLNEFASSIRSAATVTPEMRNEVSQFMKQEDLLRYITLDTFLEPETAAPVTRP